MATGFASTVVCLLPFVVVVANGERNIVTIPSFRHVRKMYRDGRERGSIDKNSEMTRESRGLAKTTQTRNEQGRTKDDDGNVDGTQHAEFVCLFEETVLALEDGRRGSGVSGSQ